MTDNNDKINQLQEKLELLLKKQDDFSREISLLRSELFSLKNPVQESEVEITVVEKITLEIETEIEIKTETVTPENEPFHDQLLKEHYGYVAPKKGKSDLEKFIGENLINKIGIAITVIGVAIGAKYSIDNELISPLTRIILGYLFGLGLLGFGIKLKTNYENYSAVLVSGAMAIMYFMTYAAFGFYDLFPQIIAFIIMLVFTVFTVIAALNYNKQIIAHIGLVGAYAVPFLLSDGSGNVVVLFSYVAILNIGILAIAFKKYWKFLYYAAFVITWFIFYSWYGSKYQTDEHFALALVFLSVFFVIFYLTFLAYKLLQKEKFMTEDIVLILINSFVFYGIGYSILGNHTIGLQLLGVFTLANAIIHFIVSVVIYRQNLADKNIHYLITGLVLVFVTIAIPVQLDGNWVTVIWSAEAALLFWIGRTKNVLFYEKLSYPLMMFAFLSILQDWATVYYSYLPEIPETKVTPILNVNFLTSILFIAAFTFINILNRNKNYPSILAHSKGFLKVIYFAIPTILFFVLYYAFRMEIDNYWHQLYADSAITINSDNKIPYYQSNSDLILFKTIWILIYSLFFVSALGFFNLMKSKNRKLGLVNLVALALAIVVFLTQGLFALSELRESYQRQHLVNYYEIDFSYVIIRYIAFAFVALALFTCYKYVKQDFFVRKLNISFEFLLYGSILMLISSELIHWMDIYDSKQSYKLGLSILWGIYSLFLISFGIWKKNKPLRVGAIVLFGVTLVKLFFYDISHLNTISKTIVFVSLGILLLIISFLYNKYKHLIADDEIEN